MRRDSSWTWGTARLFLRAWQLKVAGVLVCVAVAAVVVMGLVVSSLQLSAAQSADLALGSSDVKVTLEQGARLGEDRRALDARLVQAVRRAGGESVSIDYLAFNLRSEMASGGALSLTEIGDLESDDRRTSIVDGRRPREIGEVMVSTALAGELPLDSEFDLFAGALRLTVVGVFDDLYNTSSRRVIVPSGTWSSMHTLSAEEARRLAYGAGVIVRWRGEESIDRGIAAVASLTDTTAEAQRSNGGVEARSRIESLPPFRDAAVTIATWAGPALGGLLSGLFAGTFLARTRRAMREVGVPRSRTSGAAILALVLATCVGGLLGLVLGGATGFAIRPLVADLGGKPVGPPGGVVEALVPLALASVLAVAGAVIVSALAERSQIRIDGETPLAPVHRVALACVLVAAGIFAASTELSRSALTTGAALIACGVVVGAASPSVAAISRVRARGLASVLAIRKLAAERRATTLTIVALAALQTIGLSLVMVVNSSVDAENADTEALVPPGHVLIEPGDSPEAEEIREGVEKFAGISDPVALRLLEAEAPARSGLIFVVGTGDDVERLIGRDLAAAESAVLHGDGILFTGPLDVDDGRLVTEEHVTAAPSSAVLTDVPSEFRHIAGFVIERTAAVLDVPVNHELRWQYVDATPEQVSLAADAAEELGFAAEFVVVHVPPDVIAASVRTMTISLMASLLAAALLVASASAQIRSLRPDLAGLRAVGVDSRFLARVTTIRVGVTVAAATVLAIGSVTVATAVALSIQSDIPLSIPWIPVTVFVGLVVSVGALAAGWSSRRLRAMDRA